ncbi:unnamed protein product [Allacma fusca]|uniref:Replication factor C subunit 1 n=1 Tax=Allacma fusca TaxID=39272 RepID=A0A8J2J9Y1_9HEXA|nr:unnamed protein product [Allacma fusca]
MKPSKDKKTTKSGDIRSYFKAFSTSSSSGQTSRQSNSTETSSSSSGKRKATQLSDEEDFNSVKNIDRVEKSSSKASESKIDVAGHAGKNKKPKVESPTEGSKVSKRGDETPVKPSSSRGESPSKRNRTQSPKTEAVKEGHSPRTKKDDRGKLAKNAPSVQHSSAEGSSESSSKGKNNTESKSANPKIKLPKGGYAKSANLEIDRHNTSESKKRSVHNADRETDDHMPPPSKKKSKESEITPAKTTPIRKSVQGSPASKTPESTPDEKKRQNSSNYFKFLSRGGPRNLGAKEFPEGAPKCLENLTFVLSGVLPSFERDDVSDVITQYGGRVTTGVSKKTNYVIIGDEAGASKTKKAESLGIPLISEDDFLDMLRKSNPSASTSSNGNKTAANESLFEKSYSSEVSMFEKSEVVEPTPYKSKSFATPKKRFEDFHDFDSDLETPPKVRAQRISKTQPISKSSPGKDTKDVRNALSLGGKSSRSSEKDASEDSQKMPIVDKASNKIEASRSPKKTIAVKNEIQPTSSRSIPKSSSANVPKPPTAPAPAGQPPQMWVDKYKPATLKNIVGQTGDRSNAKKLLMWLQNWFQFHGSANDKAKANYPGLRDPDGKTFKAALLSGPPGVGKTTTAHLCCAELKYDYYEMNASDQRNKKGLHEGISDSLSNTTLFFPGMANANQAAVARKHVLIMDEVDGMSGNEDRGGVQELIALIKSSRIPIICICNDRNHQKIRSLANYCFDLRFTKPRNEQLKSFVQSICFKEKVKIPPDAVQQLIISTDQDVRQILHQLQMFKDSDSKTVYNPRKDLRLGPWDVARKVFSSHDHVGMTINDKASLFFQDYSIGPLFVQENYLRSVPNAANGNPQKMLDLAKAAAETLAIGDCVDNVVRKNNAWSLLPVQAIFSSVLPGEYMEGAGMLGIEFPQWLGKNSNRNKRARLIQEVYTHLHLQISGSTDALNMDYLPYLRRSIVNPLSNGEVEEAAHQMTSYNLLRDDLESLNDLALWPNMRNNLDKVDSKSKAAFTRIVNKESFVPYSTVKVTKGRKGAAADQDDLELEDGEEVEEEEEGDKDALEKDAMIKIKKPRAKPAPKANPKNTKNPSKGAKKGEDFDIDSDSEEDLKPKAKARKGGSSGSSQSKSKKKPAR